MDVTSASVVDKWRLDTVFHTDRVEHRIITSDQSRGLRRVETIETWTKVRELDNEGFSRVWLEEEAGSGKVRAIKEVWKPTKGVDISVELKESLALAFSATDNVLFVELEGWFQNESRLYIAMEYFEFGDLDTFLSGPLPEQEAKEILGQVTEALSFIHRKGIAHHRIKPRNIFVVERSPGWWVKVGDLGTTIQALGPKAEKTSHPPFWSAYLAPELISDNANGSATDNCAADIWALGCLSYWLVTKTDQFQNLDERNEYSRTNDLNMIELISRGITYSYRQFIRTCLTIIAQDRPTADTLLQSELLRQGDTKVAAQGSIMPQHGGKTIDGFNSLSSEAGPSDTLPAYEETARDLKEQTKSMLRETKSDSKKATMEPNYTASSSKTDPSLSAPPLYEEDALHRSEYSQDQMDAPQHRSFFKQAKYRLSRAFHGEKSASMRDNSEPHPSLSRRRTGKYRAYGGPLKAGTRSQVEIDSEEYRRPSVPPCYHKLLTSCRLIHPHCCACLDARPYAELYEGYKDGVGNVGHPERWRYYCPACQKFWKTQPPMTEKSVLNLQA